MQAERNDLVPEAQTPEWYAELAKRATGEALGEMGEGGSDDDAAAALSLASAAWDVFTGYATDEVRADMDEYVLTDDDGYELRGPECTCPERLRSTGGFTSTCPVHGSRRA